MTDTKHVIAGRRSPRSGGWALTSDHVNELTRRKCPTRDLIIGTRHRDPDTSFISAAGQYIQNPNPKFHQVGFKTAAQVDFIALLNLLWEKQCFIWKDMHIWELGMRTSDRIPITFTTLDLEILLSLSYQHKQSICCLRLTTLALRTLDSTWGSYL